MPATQQKLSRRDLLRRTAAGVTAAGAVTYGGAELVGSPVEEAEALVPAAIGAGLLAGGAVGYVARERDVFNTGDDFDEDAYDEAEADEIHASIRERAIESNASDEAVITTMQNLLENSRKIAYSDARYAAIERMNLEESESDTLSEAKDVVDEFFTVQQTNLVKHHDKQLRKIERMVNTYEDETGESYGDVFYAYEVDEDGEKTGDSASGVDQYTDRDISLIDGSDYTKRAIDYRDGVYYIDQGIDNADGVQNIVVEPVDSGSQEDAFNNYEFTKTWGEIEDAHSDTISEIETFVEEVYPDYEAGDIDLDDVVRGSDLADLGSEDADDPIAGADLAAMGISSDSTSSMVVEVPSYEITFNGALYLQDESSPTLDTGRTYSPGDFEGAVWLAYSSFSPSDATIEGEEPENSGIIQLEEDFTLVEATDSEGSQKDTVTFEDPAGQQESTTDPDELAEELDRLSELQSELRDQQKEEASGGAGAGLELDDGNRTLLAVGAAVVVGWLAFGDND